MKHLLIIFYFLTAPAFATRITYHKDSTNFVAEYDGKTLSYMSTSLKHVFVIDNCNRKMVETFWTKLLKNADKFPRATSLPNEKRGYVQVDSEYRLILPLLKNRLLHFEQEVLALRALEKKKCKR